MGAGSGGRLIRLRDVQTQLWVVSALEESMFAQNLAVGNPMACKTTRDSQRPHKKHLHLWKQSCQPSVPTRMPFSFLHLKFLPALADLPPLCGNLVCETRLGSITSCQIIWLHQFCN